MDTFQSLDEYANLVACIDTYPGVVNDFSDDGDAAGGRARLEEDNYKSCVGPVRYSHTPVTKENTHLVRPRRNAGSLILLPVFKDPVSIRRLDSRVEDL